MSKITALVLSLLLLFPLPAWAGGIIAIQNFGAFKVPAAAGGGSCTGFAGDTFTDTNATNLESHTPTGGCTGTWTAVGTPGAVKIDTNHAYNSVEGDWFGYYLSPNPADANYSVYGTIHANAATDTVMGPAGRVVTASGAGYFARWSGGAGTWELYSGDGAGGATSLGSYLGDSPASADRVVKLRMNSTTISVDIDAVQRISVTNSDFTATGKCGFIVFYFTGNSTSWIDDYVCDDTP